MKTQTFGTEIEVNRISRQAAARAIAGVLSTDGYTAERFRREHRRTPGPRHRVRHPGVPLGRPRNGAGLRSGLAGGGGTRRRLLRHPRARRAGEPHPPHPAELGELGERQGRPPDPSPADFPARIWYDDRNWEWHAHQHYDPSRYHLLNLHAVWQKGTIEFRAFNSTLHAGEVKAYIQLCLAISHQALTVASASPNRPVTDNPAYTFRCWLLRLGMNGEEFKTARTHLLKHLPGNAAWRNGAETTRRAS